MADRQPAAPTHRAYSVIRREARMTIGSTWACIPAQGRQRLQPDPSALPLDGKIVCREITEEAPEEGSLRQATGGVRGARERARDEPRCATSQTREALRDRGLHRRERAVRSRNLDSVCPAICCNPDNPRATTRRKWSRTRSWLVRRVPGGTMVSRSCSVDHLMSAERHVYALTGWT